MPGTLCAGRSRAQDSRPVSQLPDAPCLDHSPTSHAALSGAFSTLPRRQGHLPWRFRHQPRLEVTGVGAGRMGMAVLPVDRLRVDVPEHRCTFAHLLERRPPQRRRTRRLPPRPLEHNFGHGKDTPRRRACRPQPSRVRAARRLRACREPLAARNRAAPGVVVAGVVEQAYARSDLFGKRRALLEFWARYLGREAGDVFQLPRMA